MPGKTLQVGLCIWFLAGLNKSKKNLKLTKKSYNELFNVTRQTLSNSLKRMEEAGLIKLKREEGQAYRVSIPEKYHLNIRGF